MFQEHFTVLQLNKKLVDEAVKELYSMKLTFQMAILAEMIVAFIYGWQLGYEFWVYPMY